MIDSKFESIFLIRGVFGSGKSQVLTELLYFINQKYSPDFKVLILGITNISIDNILERLVADNDLSNQLVQRLGTGCANEELFQFVRTEFAVSCQFTFVTCASVQKCSNQNFDLVIIDEASQMKEFEFLYVLNQINCVNLLLCGDPAQLPPIANLKTLQISVFQKYLMFGFNQITLWSQYRCNEYISDLSSQLFYDGQVIAYNNFKKYLECIIDDYRVDQGIDLVSLQHDQQQLTKIKLIKRLDQLPLLIPPVCTFRLCPSMDQVRDGSRFNVTEAQNIIKLVTYLVDTNQILPSKVGIISPYKAQIEYLKNNLPDCIEISTVDSFQGGEKDLLVISLVKNFNEQQTDLSRAFLETGCRINVALTRAINNLIIFQSYGNQIISSSTIGYWNLIVDYTVQQDWSFNTLDHFITWQQQGVQMNVSYDELFKLYFQKQLFQEYLKYKDVEQCSSLPILTGSQEQQNEQLQQAPKMKRRSSTVNTLIQNDPDAINFNLGQKTIDSPQIQQDSQNMLMPINNKLLINEFDDIFKQKLQRTEDIFHSVLKPDFYCVHGYELINILKGLEEKLD